MRENKIALQPQSTRIGWLTSRLQNHWLPLAVIAIGQIIVTIDATVMFVALPSVQRSLGMSDATRQWVVIAYTLAFGGLLLLGGRLADRLGARRIVMYGVIGFAVAAAVGGAAVNPAMLLIARAAQGAAAALLVASNKSLLTTIYSDPRERAQAFGYYGATLATGAVGGLILGGLLTDFLSWRWCLYINIPVAVTAFIGGLLILPNLDGRREVHLDLPSVALSALGFAGLVYGSSQAASDGWGSPRIIAPLIGGALLLVAFTVRQLTNKYPLLPLRVITERNRAGANIALILNSLSTFGMLLLLTYQLQTIKHDSPLATAAALVPFMAVTVLTSAILVPWLTARLAPRYLVFAGLILSGVGLLALVPVNSTSSYIPLILIAEILEGFGTGLTGPAALNISLSGVERTDTGVASAMSSVSGQFGSSIGTALFNTIALSATATYVATHALGSPTSAAIVHGYSIAEIFGGAVLIGGAALVAILINAAPPRTSESSSR